MASKEYYEDKSKLYYENFLEGKCTKKVRGIILNEEGQILLLHSNRHNGYSIPGGTVEDEESIKDTVLREVFEETGLNISSPQLCGIKDWIQQDGTRYMVLFYKTDKFEGTLKSSDEGEVYWITLEEMKQKKLAYGMDKILPLLFAYL